MSKLMYGVGVNDANYIVKKSKLIGYIDGKQKSKIIWRCPFWAVWVDMIRRCYSIKFQEKNPSYLACTVCEGWLTFSNFKAWMETQDWEGKQLDKDILFPENKLYSPETCVFVSQLVNLFIVENKKKREEWPVGVCWHKQINKFVANCSNPFKKKREFLGSFDCPQEAHMVWLKRKLELAKLLATERDDPRVAEALIKRYENRIDSQSF